MRIQVADQTAQDIGGEMTATVSGLANFTGTLLAAIGPVAAAWIVDLSGSWALAATILGAVAILGVLLWLGVHPDKVFDMQEAMGKAA